MNTSAMRSRWRVVLFVALALLAADRLGARLADGAERSLCVVNGRIFGHPNADAIVAVGGRIAAVGKRGELRVPEDALVLDAGGGHVLPGFHDAHIHMVSGGMSLQQLELSGHPTMEAVLAALREYARAHPGNHWVQGRGWQYDIVPRGKLPTRQELDRIVSDRPVILTSYDGHSFWVNSRALAIAEVDAETPDPPGGRIVREADGKTPTGIFLETAERLITRFVPQPDRSEKLAAMTRAARHCVSLGITTVNDLASDTETIKLYQELLSAGDLPLRVIVSLPLEGDLDEYQRLRESFRSSELQVGFLKGFVDGVVESRTAFMLAPYVETQESGKPLLGAERMRELVANARARGFVVGVHAVGDGAVRLALDAFERAPIGKAGGGLLGRIEHVEVLDPADAIRFGRGRVVASMMPYHANPGGPSPDENIWAVQLGASRVRHGFPFRELLDAGATLAFGSDWPVMSADPLWGIAVATTRQDADQRPAGGWNAHQRITAAQAIRAYSHGSAVAANRDQEMGRLESGLLADLVVLQPAVDPERPETLWHGDRIRYVVVGGVVRHDALRGGEGR